MPSIKALTVGQLAQALARLSPKQRQTLVEILDRENLKARRILARQEMSKRKTASEKQLFKGLN